MRKQIKRRSNKVGLPPGSLVHIGEEKAEEVKISIFSYQEENFEEKVLQNVEETFPYKDLSAVSWINIDGLHRVDIIEKIGTHFNLHPLLLEDILNTGQRPKIEDLEDYIFIVLKMIQYKGEELNIEQVSLILGPHYVLSFQEWEGDVFDSIRERIRKGKGRIRKAGTDYLVYCLLDTIIDNYFIILEKFGDKIEELEKELIENPATETLHKIHALKNNLILLRKSIWPLREVINNFEKSESSLIKKSTDPYFRDVYDHTIQIMDTVETFRDLLTGMLDTYMSSISNKMNEVMKVLTIIATIFIPLTFIAGLYGMNFKYMPELEWTWGYFIVLGVMFIVGSLMVIYFSKKKWL